MPGVWGCVYIRGRASLNSGTQPLYVIDGMPVNSDTDAISTSDNNMVDPMSSINPADIESITVLKMRQLQLSMVHVLPTVLL